MASGDELSAEEQEQKAKVEEFIREFETAMEDDNNTANAETAVFEIVRLANSTAGEGSSKAYLEYVLGVIRTLCDGVLGVITDRKAEGLDAEIEDLINQRQAARKARDFKTADAIRDQLNAMGIILEDTKDGVKWKRA
jgi:cysteinyl-tRNA synthetase